MTYIWHAKHMDCLVGSYSSEEEACKDQCYFSLLYIYHVINDAEKDNNLTNKIQDLYIVAKKIISLCQNSQYIEAIELYNNSLTFNKIYIFKSELHQAKEPIDLIYYFE